ncbi:MAG: hypothetical protein AB7L76_06345 [Burkholderiaceae bacterium]
MNRVLVGTERGLLLMAETSDGWSLRRTMLPDFEVSSVVRSGNGRSLYVATRQAGVFNVDPDTGQAEAIGAGSLPAGVRCISVAPTDPNMLYVGCEPAALYRSRDGGRTWQECVAVTALARERNWRYHIDRIPAHIRHILIDRRSPERIYAAVQIGGLIYSDDGGQSWTDVVDSIDADVHVLAQHPQQADVLFAATGGGGPIGGPHPPVPPNGYGLYRSQDAGRSWVPMSAGMERQHSVPLHLPEGQNLILSALARGVPTNWRRAAGADAVFVASRDGGHTWTQGGEGLPESFPLMIDSIDSEPKLGGRTYIGVGGEGTKVLPAELHRGWVYYANEVAGPWQKLPYDFPTVFTVTVV